MSSRLFAVILEFVGNSQNVEEATRVPTLVTPCSLYGLWNGPTRLAPGAPAVDSSFNRLKTIHASIVHSL